MEINLRAFILGACLLGIVPTNSRALELKTQRIVLTDRVYTAVDADSVTAESHHPTKEWFKKLKQENRALAAELTLEPLAELDIRRQNPHDEITSFEPMMQEARKTAARMGGNFLYLVRPINQNGEAVGLFFRVYRVEYQNNLVTPGYLASFSPQLSQVVSPR